MADNKIQADMEVVLKLDAASLATMSAQIQAELNRVMNRSVASANATAAPGGVQQSEGMPLAGPGKMEAAVADSLAKGITKSMPALTDALGKALGMAFGGNNVLGSARNVGAAGALGNAFGLNGGMIPQLMNTIMLPMMAAFSGRSGIPGMGSSGIESVIGATFLGNELKKGKSFAEAKLGEVYDPTIEILEGANPRGLFTSGTLPPQIEKLTKSRKIDSMLKQFGIKGIFDMWNSGEPNDPKSNPWNTIKKGLITDISKLGAIAKIGTAVGGVIIAFEALKAIVERLLGPLTRAIEAGAKLYEQSRMMGLTTGATALLHGGLNAIGIDPSMAMRLSAYGQFRPGINSQEFAGETLSAGMRIGMSQLEIQQIRNMMPVLMDASRRLEAASRQMGEAAKTNFDTVYQWNMFKADFSAFWQQMGKMVGPIFQTMLYGLDGILRLVNRITEFSQKYHLSTFLIPENGFFDIIKHFINPPDTGSSRFTPYLRDTHFSALEKMGLVIGHNPNAALDYARRTAVGVENLVNLFKNNTGIHTIGTNYDFSPRNRP